MSRERVTRWSQRSIVAGALFLVTWHLVALAGAPRRTLVTLALLGVVLHVVLGKAYSLVPSYFDRQMQTPSVPTLQVPLTVAGTTLLAAGPWIDGAQVERAGAVIWAVGILLFLAGLTWTLGDNPTGAETATGGTEAERHRVDRVANAFVPIALANLLAGTYALAAPQVGLPPLIDGYPPRGSHLIAAGFAALVLFAVGFRLLPRFTAATPPRGAVWVVLPAGAVGPWLIVVGLPGGGLLQAGAALESAAVVGFAGVVATLYYRTDRDRVGLYGVLAAAAAGVAGVAVGTWMAVAGPWVGAAQAHLRLNLLGLLGLSIVGVVCQFYPPSVGPGRLADDRTALTSIVALAVGLSLQTAGLLGGWRGVTAGGVFLGTAGSLLFAWLVVGVLRERGQV